MSGVVPGYSASVADSSTAEGRGGSWWMASSAARTDVAVASGCDPQGHPRASSQGSARPLLSRVLRALGSLVGYGHRNGEAGRRAHC